MDSQIVQFFENQYEENWYLTARRRVLTTVVDALRGSAPWRLVDVGGGTGSILAHLAERNGGIVIEGDWQLARVGQARHRLPFVVADIGAAIPLRGGSADAVLSLDVLEHLDDDGAALAEIFRILKPGGTLIVAVPALQALWSRHDELHHHRRRYSKRTLLAALAATGFSCRRVTYYNSLLFPVVYAARRWERIRGVRPDAPTDYEKATWLAGVLQRVFELEARILTQWNLPVGVSLLAVATRP